MLRKTSIKTRNITWQTRCNKTNNLQTSRSSDVEIFANQGRGSKAEEEGATPSKENVFICFKHG
jgi:hypothetical protein